MGKGAGPIPAGAGETSFFGANIDMDGAYPRGRGGNPRTPGTRRCSRGLSPRARGKPVRDQRIIVVDGPIPAGAGETADSQIVAESIRAYPRGRGGNAVRDQP